MLLCTVVGGRVRARVKYPRSSSRHSCFSSTLTHLEPTHTAVPPDKEWRTLLLRSWAYQAQGQPDAAAVDLQRAEALALPSALQAAQAEAAARSVAAVAHSLGRCCSYGRRHCILCMHQPPRWALVPCGHVLLCDECHSNSVGRLKGECPADRKPFTSTLRIYL